MFYQELSKKATVSQIKSYGLQENTNQMHYSPQLKNK